MNPIALELGPISIYWYSITMLIAILIGSYIFIETGKKRGYEEKFLTDLIFYGAIFGIIGARLYYVLFNLNYYLTEPLQILAVWNGGLAIHGGIIGGAAWFIYYSNKHKKNFLRLFDIAAPALILAQAIGRWGNFFNSEAHGPQVARETLENMHIPEFIINGMNIDGIYYHPTFFYESIWNILGFIILIIISKKVKLKTGRITGLYFIWYSICRFFIEALRTDSLMLGPIKVAQLISIILIIIGLFLILYDNKKVNIKKIKERIKEYGKHLRFNNNRSRTSGNNSSNIFKKSRIKLLHNRKRTSRRSTK